MLQFLTESSRDFTETQTVGGFRNNSASSFDTIFEEAYENMKYVTFKDSYCRTDIGIFK